MTNIVSVDWQPRARKTADNDMPYSSEFEVLRYRAALAEYASIKSPSEDRRISSLMGDMVTMEGFWLQMALFGRYGKEAFC